MNETKTGMIYSEPNKQNEDLSLPAIMASLETLTMNTGVASPIKSKMTLRKRIRRDISNDILNRRCSLKPKKRTHTMMEDEDEIKGYYLDKSLKMRTKALETIFEESDDNKTNANIGTKRFKRMIKFEPQPTDSKIKKRRAKIKKIFGSKVNLRKKHISMQLLLDRLNSIRSESPPTNNENK